MRIIGCVFVCNPKIGGVEDFCGESSTERGDTWGGGEEHTNATPMLGSSVLTHTRPGNN